MSDPQSPGQRDTPPATPSSMGTKIDVIQMLREAQGDAEKVSLAQAELRGRLDQALADDMTQNPKLIALAKALDEIRTIADEAAAISASLPGAYAVIVKTAAHWIDVADDALAPLGL